MNECQFPENEYVDLEIAADDGSYLHTVRMPLPLPENGPQAQALAFVTGYMPHFVDNVNNSGAKLPADIHAKVMYAVTLERLNQANGICSFQPATWKTAAESVGIALYDLWREMENNADRVSRYGQGAFRAEGQAYADITKALLEVVRIGRLEQAERAFLTLRALQPNKHDAALVAQVLEALGDVVALPHPERVPPLQGHY